MESWRKEFYASDYGSTYLAHHGIKGQRWGIRRFQNEDGTLTEAGKERYSNRESKQLYKEIKKNTGKGYISESYISSEIFKEARQIMNDQKNIIDKTNSDINQNVYKMFSDLNTKVKNDKNFKEEIIKEAIDEAKKYGNLIEDDYELEMYVNDTLPERLYEKYKTKTLSDLETKYRNEVRAYHNESKRLSESLLGYYADKQIRKSGNYESAANIVQDLLANGERWETTHAYMWDPDRDKLGMNDPGMNWNSYNKMTKEVFPEVIKRLGLKTD